MRAQDMSAKMPPITAPTTISASSTPKNAAYSFAARHAARGPAAIQVIAGTMAHISTMASANRRN